MNRGY